MYSMKCSLYTFTGYTSAGHNSTGYSGMGIQRIGYNTPLLVDQLPAISYLRLAPCPLRPIS